MRPYPFGSPRYVNHVHTGPSSESLSSIIQWQGTILRADILLALRCGRGHLLQELPLAPPPFHPKEPEPCWAHVTGHVVDDAFSPPI
jgi:hypothetical protein